MLSKISKLTFGITLLFNNKYLIAFILFLRLLLSLLDERFCLLVKLLSAVPSSNNLTPYFIILYVSSSIIPKPTLVIPKSNPKIYPIIFSFFSTYTIFFILSLST